MSSLRMVPIEARRAIALAPLDELYRQCERIALLPLDAAQRVEAEDVLYDAAVANRLVKIHGDDFITRVIADAFASVSAASVSKGRVA